LKNPGASRVAIHVPPSIAALDIRHTIGSPITTLIFDRRRLSP
jgi:hypothetical protein